MAQAIRTDHVSYRQAVRVCSFGLLLQLALGLVLLLYGILAKDSAFVVASMYAGAGLPLWIGLLLTFHQHVLERIEALENDETAAEGAGLAASIFAKDTTRPAARRLAFMHGVAMPATSLLVAALLVAAGWWTLDWFGRLKDPTATEVEAFQTGASLGWQLAICIGLALVAFIFSRFVAGMSRQPAWANLRGGAGMMVGNAVVLLAIAIGIVFLFLERPAVLEGIVRGVAVFMIAFAGEILLNFVLNLYRPRRPGEFPRPAFDSRVLSLLAAPDSIVRSINEAVNYQFGFDVTSSWGYQLLLRSTGRLALLGAVVLVGLSTLVVVEPGDQALRLRFGRPVDGVYEGRTMVKLPWPVETAQIHPTGRLRDLALGTRPETQGEFKPWGSEGALDPAANLYLVAAPTRSAALESSLAAVDASGIAAGGNASSLADQFALVDADIVLQWRVRDGELRKFLEFSNDSRTRRSPFDMRERLLRASATREVTQFLSTQPLDRILAAGESSLETELRNRIQAAFDGLGSGVELVGVAIPRLRPPGAEADRFVELSISVQNARKVVEQARSTVNTTMATLIGAASRAPEVVAAIESLRRIEREKGPESPEATEQRLRCERALLESTAATASVISSARARRWELHMDARRNAAEVLGEAAAWSVDPELYRQRALMRVLAENLRGVRVKYVLGGDPARTRVDVEMKEVESGLNLADYIAPEGEN
jgi:regulator of protease activity HflC (stomatin/prohibitin superfamily)